MEQTREKTGLFYYNETIECQFKLEVIVINEQFITMTSNPFLVFVAVSFLARISSNSFIWGI